MIKNVIKASALGALALTAAVSGAEARFVTQPGERIGLAAGAPLPEGVYFVNTLDWGVRRVEGVGTGKREDLTVAVDIPVIAWSTPWQIAGGRVQILLATPLIHVGIDSIGVNEYGFYNPFAAVQLAWDLGGGLGVSYYAGGYFNVGSNNDGLGTGGDDFLRSQSTSFNHAVAVSYTADGWNLTANLINGIHFDVDNDAGFNGKYADFFNLDVTATKKFGKWEFGVVGYGNWDYDLPRLQKRSNGGPGGAKEIALGLLVGYDFGGLTAQAYVTRDVYSKNQLGVRADGKDTRLWTRVIIPLYSPEAPLAPLVTKY